MKSTPTTRLVAAREISERIGSRTLRITTAVMTVLVIAGVVIPSFLGGSESPTSVGLVGTPAQALAPALRLTARAAKVKIAVRNLASGETARSEVKDGSLDIALSVGERIATAEVAQSLSSTMRALLAVTIDGVHQRLVLREAGVPQATIVAAQTPLPLATVAVKPRLHTGPPATSPRSPQATAPLTYPLIAGYLLVYAAIGSPNSTVVRVLSFLPPLAPSLMPARIALGGVAWWEMSLDVLVMAAAVYGMIRLASRIYTGALMHSGPRLTWRAALRLRKELP